jgi:Spy/CpxP family protein refolding chaperone
MKRIAFTLFIAFTIVNVFAQSTTKPQTQNTSNVPSKTVEQRAQEVTASMTKHLNLNAQQVKKIGVINLTNMQHLQEAIEKYKTNSSKLTEQVDMINQTRLSQIKDVLTPHQFLQYQQRREEKLGVPKEMQSNPASRQEGSSYNYEN